MYINSCRLTTAQKCANVYAVLSFDECEKGESVSAAKFNHDVVPGVVSFTEAALRDAYKEINGDNSALNWFNPNGLFNKPLFPVLLNGIVESVLNGYIRTWDQYHTACVDAVTLLRK